MTWPRIRGIRGRALLPILCLLLGASAHTQAPPPDQSRDDLAAALAPLSRLSASVELFVYGVAREHALDVVAEVPMGRTQGGRWTNGAEVEAVASDAAGRSTPPVRSRIEPASRGTRLAIPRLEGDAGPWRVRVKASAAGETLEESITIAPVASGRLVGPPILYRLASSPRAPSQPVADFQLRRTGRLRLEWPVLRPLDARRVRLLRASGQPIALAILLNESSGGVLAAEMSLAPLAPSDYVLELTTESRGQSSRQLIAIRVLP